MYSLLHAAGASRCVSRQSRQSTQNTLEYIRVSTRLGDEARIYKSIEGSEGVGEKQAYQPMEHEGGGGGGNQLEAARLLQPPSHHKTLKYSKKATTKRHGGV